MAGSPENQLKLCSTSFPFLVPIAPDRLPLLDEEEPAEVKVNGEPVIAAKAPPLPMYGRIDFSFAS
jgi:hypothetical protein